MSEKKSRREFLSAGAKAAGITGAFGLGLLADIKINPDKGIKIADGTHVDIGVAEASAGCGMAYNCSGGGGQCGMAYNCSGGGGQCGMAYNCSGS